MPTLAPQGAARYAPSRPAVPSIIATYELSPFESFVATVTERRDGRRICAISRIKRTPSGGLRRSAVFEFGEHRAVAVASLVDELLRAIAAKR
jgi:hypothetical protein